MRSFKRSEYLIQVLIGPQQVVGAQLVRTGENLYYCREGNHEIDFILQRGRHLWAIEVKSSRRRIGKGLQVFKEKYPKANLVIIDSENYFEFEEDPMRFLEKYISAK